jgi:putative ABC transport system permease protein
MVHDVRLAIRTLARTPGLTIPAWLMLTLGIGATTAIFSVASGVLLRPLPYADPDRLVEFGTTAIVDLEDCRADNRSFESILSYQTINRTLQGDGDPERIATVAAEHGMLALLGVQPIGGRIFDHNDGPNVAVVSEGFWKRRFGQTSIGDRTITLDGQTYTVIGIMPAAFQFPYRSVMTDVWTPSTLPRTPNRFQRVDAAIGRLRTGVSLAAARVELQTIARRLEAAHADTNAGRTFSTTPLTDAVVGRSRTALLTLLGAVGMVLLIACANVANLLLVRSEARTHEIAIRTALGATRSRLIRQCLTESLLLTITGGVASLLVALAGTRLLVSLAASQIPRAWEIGLDWRVFVFLIGTSIATGIALGLVPARYATRPGVSTLLNASSGRSSRGRRASLVRDSLIVTEMALAFILLIGAGLLLRAFVNIRNVPTGFVAEHVLTLRMDARGGRVAGAAPATLGGLTGPGQYFRDIEDRVLQIPGVRAAGFTTTVPTQGGGYTGQFAIAGQPSGPADRNPVGLRYVTPGYFRALGIPLERGRIFLDAEPQVVLVNDAFVRQHLNGRDPLGVVLDRGTIVGVVGDVRQTLGRPPVPEIYYSLGQAGYSSATLVVSAELPPATLVNTLRAAIRNINSNQAVYNVRTMEDVVATAYADLSLSLWLMGLFAGLAVLLSMTGIYGVISYAVASRRREFGIRLALGADGGRLLRHVLAHSGRLIAAGVIIGCAGALAMARVLRALLYEVAPNDPATFGIVSLLLAVAAVAACVAPARRVLGLDPVVVLRYE